MTALMMTLAIAPATFPADAMRDVAFKLTFRNGGGAPALIYPGAAKLCAHVSTAGTGICWQIRFDSKSGAAADVREIRSWYGPPGEPPAATAIKKQTEVRLAPGKEKTAELRACWIPNSRSRARQRCCSEPTARR
jgi:hypothetical protein